MYDSLEKSIGWPKITLLLGKGRLPMCDTRMLPFSARGLISKISCAKNYAM